MYKHSTTGAYYFNQLKEEANFMVTEMSSGIYNVNKDRFGDEVEEYITANRVVEMLCNMEKVIVVTKKNEYYSNSRINNNFYLI